MLSDVLVCFIKNITSLLLITLLLVTADNYVLGSILYQLLTILIFSYICSNIDCGYTLELLRHDD